MIKRFLDKTLHHLTASSKQRTQIQSHVSSSLFHSNLDSKENSLMDANTPTSQDGDVRLKAHQICSDHLGGPWRGVPPSEMSFVPVSGGMSNAIYCCSLPESFQCSDSEVPSQVLLRLYGDTSGNCDISVQLEIFKMLSIKNLGPKLYGQFEDGRLEEFLPATSLTCDELMDRAISTIIAKKLAVVHSLDVPMDKTSNWILDKFNEWSEFIRDNVKVPIKTGDIRQSTIDIAQELLSIDYRKEIDFLGCILDKSHSPIVFSHNDLHQGNILLAKQSKRRPTLEERVFIIDFEYSSYNHRAYDIANHFSEWCFEYDTPDYPHFNFYEQRFPSEEAQVAFVRSYLIQSQLSTCPPDNSSNNKTKSTNVMKNHCDNITFTNGDHVNGHRDSINGKTPEEVHLLDEIKPFNMVSCFLWMLWSIKTSHCSNIKFGYWEHAMARWKFYGDFKDAYIADTKAKSNFIK